MPKTVDILQFEQNDETDYGSEVVSPLSLSLDTRPLNIVIQRPPAVMPGYHWHGHMEINVPFDDEVEYLFNGVNIRVKANHIALFWASVPHRLVDIKNCRSMAVLDIPVYQFLSWQLPQQLINHVIHGMAIQSQSAELVSEFEIKRWEKEIQTTNLNRQQLVYDEIQLMIKRIGYDGWDLLSERLYHSHDPAKTSRHTQSYVSTMLDYIANHYNEALTIDTVASAVGLNANYAMGLFQSVMQLTIKQYITMMRINHAKALLSDTDKTMLDISLTVGFNSISRFYDNFQKYAGLSPLNYRKLIRTNDKWSAQGMIPTSLPGKGASNGQHLILGKHL